MRKWYAVASMVAAGTFAMACADSPTSVKSKAATPKASPTLVNGAAFTTTNETYDGGNYCNNGNPSINCNIYQGKQYVWLDGGPAGANLSDGTYLFAVVAPSGQGGNDNPNDGELMNLSDVTPTSHSGAGDTYHNRIFTVSSGVVSYTGNVGNVNPADDEVPHVFNSGKIRLLPYDDTPNNGGVYILAICSLASGYPVVPSSCKYDAFKVGSTPFTSAAAPTVSKTAAGSYKSEWSWGIAKAVDKTKVTQAGGNATFNYTITLTRSGPSSSDYKVTGTITVANSNASALVIDGVTDALSDGTNAYSCSLTGSPTFPATVPAAASASTPGTVSYGYQCLSLPASILSVTTLTNKATATWSHQVLDDGSELAAGFADYTYPTISNGDAAISFAQTKINNQVNVTDVWDGGATTLNWGAVSGTTLVFNDASTPDLTTPDRFTITYSKSVAVPASGCITKLNTARYVSTSDATINGSSQVTVTVCGPARTGALTIGFWQNKNGQGIITAGASTSGVCNSGSWLRTYAPFQDLGATANCGAVATYVYNIIKAANSAGTTMNPMLKAQMLATALDVYFSDPLLGGNKIGQYSGLGLLQPKVGDVIIDLTKICQMIDGSGGTATCGGTYQNVSAAFGGATSMSISQMLTTAASYSNSGGTYWYNQIKTTQELAKNAFDAINNRVALAP